MATSKALNIVNKAVANRAHFKLAARDLEKLDADPQATRALIDAFRSGVAPPWMVAHLLGCSGHDDGYPVAREILLLAPGCLAESYAGVALAKIRGDRAFEDLASLVTEAPHKVSREGAAYGLQHVGGSAATRTIAVAGRDGCIQPKVAASILADLPTSAQLLLEILDSESDRGLLIVTWLVELREVGTSHDVQRWTQQEEQELVDAFRRSLARHGESLSRARRRRLDQWMERRAVS